MLYHYLSALVQRNLTHHVTCSIFALIEVSPNLIRSSRPMISVSAKLLRILGYTVAHKYLLNRPLLDLENISEYSHKRSFKYFCRPRCEVPAFDLEGAFFGETSFDGSSRYRFA